MMLSIIFGSALFLYISLRIRPSNVWLHNYVMVVFPKHCRDILRGLYMRGTFVGKLKLIGLVTFALLVVSCGGSKPSGATESSGDAASVKTFAPGDVVPIAVAVTGTNGLGLANIPADSLTIKVNGCASGWQTTCTGGSFDVYNMDLGCVAQLVSFTSSGSTYNQSSSCSSSTWKAGTQCSFVNSTNSSDIVTITVVQTLSSPTTPTDKVIFEWGAVGTGNSQQFLSNTLGFSTTSSLIKQSDPNFQISLLAYYGINSDGSGNFGFNLTCGNNMTVDSSNTTQGITICDGAKLSSIDYALVAKPSGTITSSLLETLMSSATVYSIAWQTGTGSEKILDGKGGFKTKAMKGSGKISSSTDMMLILRETNIVQSVPIKSYRTFSISLQPLTSCRSSSNNDGHGNNDDDGSCS